MSIWACSLSLKRRRQLRHPMVLVLGLSLSLTLAGHAAAMSAAFVPLGDLPGGTSYSQATSVSADGSTVVGYSLVDSGSEAFLWTSGSGMVGLGALPADTPWSYATGVSGDGSKVVGYANTASGNEAFLWTNADGMVGLGELSGGSYYSVAQGISADGSIVVGGSLSSLGSEPFLWTSGGGIVGLGFEADPYDISADGSTVVGIEYTDFEAFLWTSQGGVVGLGNLGGSGGSYAYGVSADGSTVVGRGSSASNNPSGAEAFLWTAASGMVDLGDFPGGNFGSIAYAVSGDGSRVVGKSDRHSGDQAVLWDATTMELYELDGLLTNLGLDLSGWTLTSASDISADGQVIVGTGINPSGQTEAWLAVVPEVPVPEPATAALALLGLAGLWLHAARP